MPKEISRGNNSTNTHNTNNNNDINTHNNNGNSNIINHFAKKNNYVNEINTKVLSLNEEIEDDMQKLNLNPTPITKPIDVQITKVNTTSNTSTNTNSTNTNAKTNTNNSKGKTDSIQAISPRKKNKSTKEMPATAKTTGVNMKNNVDKPRARISNMNTNKNYNLKQNDWNYLKDINDENKHSNYNHNYKKSNDKLDAFLREEEDDDDNFFNVKANEHIPDLIEEQDTLISSHMNIIKNEAKLLTEEGTLISQIKGVTMDNYPMEEYAEKLEEIIQKKLNNYLELKQMIQNYKGMANTKIGAWNCK